MDLLQKLTNLGVTFILTEENKVIVNIPQGFGRVKSSSGLGAVTADQVREQFPDLIVAENVPATSDALEQIPQWSPRPISAQSGSVDDLDVLEREVADPLLDNITNALRAQEGDAIAVGNENYSREDLQKIVGEEVGFTQEAVEAQRAAGEAAAAAKDAQVKERKLREQAQQKQATKGSTRRGFPQGTRVVEQPGGTFAVVDSATGTVIEGGIPVRGQALARQNQLQGGSTPSLAGRPDIFAAVPTQAEFDAGIEDITPQEGMEAVTPQVATAEGVQQIQEGVYPTAAAEGASADEFTTALEGSVASKESQALSQNPNLQVTPEMRSAWLQEAMDDLRNNKYYQEVIRNTEFDLGQSLNRLVEDTRLRELSLLQDFKTKLKSQQASLRERGFLFGGEEGGIRGQEERELADVTNLQLQGLGTQFERGRQDISMAAERTLGSTGYEGFTQGALGLREALGSVQGVGRVIPGSPVIRAGATTPSLRILGGQFGSTPRALELEAFTRAGEKEEAFRDRFSQFS